MGNEIFIFRINVEFKTLCGKAVPSTNSTPKMPQKIKRLESVGVLWHFNISKW